MNQPLNPQQQPGAQNPYDTPLWRIAALPVYATAIPEIQNPEKLQELPEELQMISFGLVGQCLTQGFLMDDHMAELHEALFEAMTPIMRFYLNLYWLNRSGLEYMIGVFWRNIDQNGEEGYPPLGLNTLALKPGVMFDNPEVAKLIVSSRPYALLWMSKTVSPQSTVSFKLLTPALKGFVDLTFGPDGDLDMQSEIEPRLPDGTDQFPQIPLEPVLNHEDYVLMDEEEQDEEEKVPAEKPKLRAVPEGSGELQQEAGSGDVGKVESDAEGAEDSTPEANDEVQDETAPEQS